MRFWIGIGIFVAALVGAFALFVLHITSSPRTAAPETAPGHAAITDVSVADTYTSKTGTHAIKGSATVPTPCTELVASSSIAAADASSSPVIRIDLSAAPDTGICLQELTPMPFSFSIHADKSASVAVYANGELATTTD